jgi:hypothetical protein
MQLDLDDLRRQYARMNDEALLAVDREQLVPLAQQCYDAELSARGLDTAAEEVPAQGSAQANLENMVEVAAFDNPSEASVARSLLRSAEIPCMLNTDLPLVGGAFPVLSEVVLYVPSEFAAQASEILDHEISEEELAAQAEAAGLIDEEETEEELEEEDGPGE